MRNIKLIIEYEGTNYCGWQEQEGLPTIQGSLIEAVRKLTLEENVKVNGASRTDAGVHAWGQVANFMTSSDIPARGIMHGLNFRLPHDISIKEAADAPVHFDPRRDSKGKTYLYRILNRTCRSAMLSRYSWFVFKPLDIARMREAARYYIGEKDFSSFMASGSDALHSIREVTSIEIFDRGDDIIELEIKGTAFLRHMVRIMAGTLAAVGTGRLRPSGIKHIIEAKDRTAADMTAPPQGLFLVRIDY